MNDETADRIDAIYEDLNGAAVTVSAEDPFIRAQALEDAAQDFPADLPEFADLGADGLIDYISVADWLRNRAKRERGEG